REEEHRERRRDNDDGPLGLRLPRRRDRLVDHLDGHGLPLLLEPRLLAQRLERLDDRRLREDLLVEAGVAAADLRELADGDGQERLAPALEALAPRTGLGERAAERLRLRVVLAVLPLERPVLDLEPRLLGPRLGQRREERRPLRLDVEDAVLLLERR